MTAEIVSLTPTAQSKPETPADGATADVITLGPALSDIPGQLRLLADMLDEGTVTAESVLLIVDNPGDYPTIFGRGEHLGDYGNIALCELAKQFFINNTTAR